jgi:hypothetical protein
VIDAQGVRALHGPAHPSLGHHVQHPALGEEGDVPVQAAPRQVGQLGGELARRQPPATQERLQDAQAHRMDEQVDSRHGGTVRH